MLPVIANVLSSPILKQILLIMARQRPIFNLKIPLFLDFPENYLLYFQETQGIVMMFPGPLEDYRKKTSFF